MDRIYDYDRNPEDTCQAGSPGCPVNHTAETKAGNPEGGCETW